jgi:hypothetical protein
VSAKLSLATEIVALREALNRVMPEMLECETGTKIKVLILRKWSHRILAKQLHRNYAVNFVVNLVRLVKVKLDYDKSF